MIACYNKIQKKRSFERFFYFIGGGSKPPPYEKLQADVRRLQFFSCFLGKSVIE